MGLPQASGPRLPPVEPESAGVGDLVSDIGVGLAKIPLVLGEDVARIARGAGAFDPATGFDPQAGAQPKGFASKAVNWLRRRSEATRLPPEEAKRGYFGTGFLRESVREGLGQAGHSLPGMAAAAGVTLAAAARGAAAGKKVAGTRGAVVGAVGGALGASLKAGAVQAAANSPMFFAVRDSRVEQLFEDRKAKNPGLTREQWAAEWPAIIANADTYARHEIESEIAQDLVHGALAKWAGAAGGIGRVLARVAASAPANAVTEVLGEAWTERSQSKRDVEMRLADGVKSWGQSIADVWQQSAAMSLFMSGLGAGWQFAANRNYRKFKGEAMPELQRMGLPAEVVEEFNKAGTPEAWGAARKKHAETIAAAAGEAGARAAEAQATRTTEDGTRKTEVPAGPVGGAVDPAAVEAQRVAREAVVAGPGTPQAAAVDQTFEAVMKAKIEGTPEAPQDAGLARWPRIENMVRARRAAGLPELPEETMDSLTAGEMGLLRPASDADLAALAGAAAGAPVARTEDGIRNTEVAAPAMAEGQSPTVGGGPGVVATAPAEPAPATADGQSPTPAGVDAAGVVEVPGETVDGILVRALGAGEGQPHAAAWEAMIDQGATDDEILKQAAVSFHLGGSKRGGAATWSYGAKKNKPSFKAQAQGEVSMLAGSYLAERIRAVLGIPQKVAPQAPERVLDTTPPAEPRVHKPVPKFSLVSINAWLDRVEKNGVASFRATDLRKTAERATDTAVRLEAFPHIPAALVLAARARRLAADAVAEALRKDAVEQSQREETTQTADGDTVATLYQRARRLMHGQARIDGLIATIKAEQRKAKEGLHGKHARLDEDGYIIDFANFGTAYGREYQYIAKEKRYAPDTVISALQKFLATSGTLTNDQADIVGRAVSFLEDEDQDEAARIEADQAPAGESQEPEPADKPAPPKPSEPATPAPLSNQRNLPQKQPDDAPIGEVFGYGPGNGVVIFRGTRTAAKDVLATYKAMGAELMAGMREFTVWIRNPTDDTMQALQYDPPPESGAVGPGGPAWAPKSESPAPAAAPAPKPEPAPAPARAPAPAPEPAPKASPKASDM
ncbi:MAG: hypothetical protein KJ579_12145, partial [Verrucomicrobia bacterium]|nr:hypothetical protein [Verrucomicrobiota bacterium]